MPRSLDRNDLTESLARVLCFGSWAMGAAGGGGVGAVGGTLNPKPLTSLNPKP